MALDELDLEIDFPALFVTAYWAEAHCIVPDGFQKGEYFGLAWWQAWSLLNFYRLRPSARLGQLAPAFAYRRSQIVGPQKIGKAPYTAMHICVEGVGPALFAGWARGGERWDCRDHGCGCGWVYEYQPGEAMAMRWPTPLIQITAYSKDQTDNVYSALRPMIDDGPLAALIPKTGEEFIRLPNDGRIDTVTSEARSRLGARVTFVPQDETGIWTPSAGMIEIANVQRRGLSGMGGRAEETTNAWDPNQNSVAQRTAENAKKTGDIFRYHPQAPRTLSYRNKEHRRKIHELVYAGSPWVDLDAIEAEATEILLEDPAQAERFYGNNPTAGKGVAFDMDVFEKRAKAGWRPPRGSVIVVGVDGARSDDALALVACDVKTGHTWPLIIIERPEDADGEYEHDLDLADGAMQDAMAEYYVWRVYMDDQWIDHLVERWTNRYGRKRIVVWPTYRPRQIAWAVREYELAIATGDEFSHDADEVLVAHHANAHKTELNVRDDHEVFMHTLAKEAKGSRMKIDGAMAAILARKARGDAIEKGIVTVDDPDPPPSSPSQPPRWQPGVAPPQELLGGSNNFGPMGPLSQARERNRHRCRPSPRGPLRASPTVRTRCARATTRSPWPRSSRRAPRPTPSSAVTSRASRTAPTACCSSTATTSRARTARRTGRSPTRRARATRS